MNDEINPKDVPLVDETPAMKAIREAQERGEDVEVKGDIKDDTKPNTVDSKVDTDKSPYEALEELYSTDVPLTLPSFGGNETHEVYVYKCRMRDMGKIIRFAKSLIGEVNKLSELDGSGEALDEVEQTSLILDVLENNLEETYSLVFDLCSIKEMDELHDLDADDGVELILAIIEVNKRFFLQKVLPLVGSVMARGST